MGRATTWGLHRRGGRSVGSGKKRGLLICLNSGITLLFNWPLEIEVIPQKNNHKLNGLQIIGAVSPVSCPLLQGYAISTVIEDDTGRVLNLG